MCTTKTQLWLLVLTQQGSWKGHAADVSQEIHAILEVEAQACTTRPFFLINHSRLALDLLSRRISIPEMQTRRARISFHKQVDVVTVIPVIPPPPNLHLRLILLLAGSTTPRLNGLVLIDHLDAITAHTWVADECLVVRERVWCVSIDSLLDSGLEEGGWLCGVWSATGIEGCYVAAAVDFSA